MKTNLNRKSKSKFRHSTKFESLLLVYNTISYPLVKVNKGSLRLMCFTHQVCSLDRPNSCLVFLRPDLLRKAHLCEHGSSTNTVTFSPP